MGTIIGIDGQERERANVSFVTGIDSYLRQLSLNNISFKV